MGRARYLSVPIVASAIMLATLGRVSIAHATAVHASAMEEAGFVVIVNAANPATSITRIDAMRIFTKKARAWPGSSLPAEPVDLRDASPVRKEFLASVIGKDASAMNAYWQSQLFVGRTTPPPVKSADADVIAFVAAARGGIGYVSAATTLPETVKILKVAQ